MKRNVPAFEAPSPTLEKPTPVRTGYRILLWGVPLLTGVYFLAGISPPLLVRLGHSYAESVLSLYSHFCHQLPERTFSVGGVSLGFCSRCTGFYGGLFLGGLTVARNVGWRLIGFPVLILLVAPALIDFWFDLSSHVWGGNLLRCFTGLLAAFGIMQFVYPRLLRAARR